MGIRIMKNILYILLFSCSFLAGNAIDYINKYFPDESVIRKKHNSEKPGTGWFGFNSDIRISCDWLNHLFSVLDKRPNLDHDSFENMHYLRNGEYIVECIKNALSDQDETVIQNELEWALQIKIHLEKKAEEAYKQTSEYQQLVAREQRREAIRQELVKREQSK